MQLPENCLNMDWETLLSPMEPVLLETSLSKTRSKWILMQWHKYEESRDHKLDTEGAQVQACATQIHTIQREKIQRRLLARLVLFENSLKTLWFLKPWVSDRLSLALDAQRKTKPCCIYIYIYTVYLYTHHYIMLYIRIYIYTHTHTIILNVKSNLAETDCSLPVSFATRMAECGTVKTLVEAMTSHVDSPLLQAGMQKLTAIWVVKVTEHGFYGFPWVSNIFLT